LFGGHRREHPEASFDVTLGTIHHIWYSATQTLPNVGQRNHHRFLVIDEARVKVNRHFVLVVFLSRGRSGYPPPGAPGVHNSIGESELIYTGRRDFLGSSDRRGRAPTCRAAGATGGTDGRDP
jgi:hypothetical protein